MKIARTCARVGAVASSVLLFGGYVWLKSGGSYASALSATEGEEHRIFAEDQGPPPSPEPEPEPEPQPMPPPPGQEQKSNRDSTLPGGKSGGPLWIFEGDALVGEKSRSESTHQKKERMLLPGSKSPAMHKKSKELDEQEKPRAVMSGSKSTFSAVNAPGFGMGTVPSNETSHITGWYFSPPPPPPRDALMWSSKSAPVVTPWWKSSPIPRVQQIQQVQQTQTPQPVDWLALPARREPDEAAAQPASNDRMAAASTAIGLAAGRVIQAPARQFIAETLAEMWTVKPYFPHEPPPNPESRHFIPATQSEDLAPRLGRLWKPLTISPKPRMRQPLPAEPEPDAYERHYEFFSSSKSGPIVPSPYRTWMGFAHLYSTGSKESIKPVEAIEP